MLYVFLWKILYKSFIYIHATGHYFAMGYSVPKIFIITVQEFWLFFSHSSMVQNERLMRFSFESVHSLFIYWTISVSFGCNIWICSFRWCNIWFSPFIVDGNFGLFHTVQYIKMNREHFDQFVYHSFRSIESSRSWNI